MTRLRYSALVDALIAALTESMKESIQSDLCMACATVTFGDCEITAETNSDDDVQLYICHRDAQRDEECPNICKNIETLIPLWGDIENEVYDEESDYTPGLDPGFGSWQDFYNYMYG